MRMRQSAIKIKRVCQCSVDRGSNGGKLAWPRPPWRPTFPGCTDGSPQNCHPKACRMRMPFASHCTTPGIGLPSSIRSRIALASGDAPPGGMP